MNDYLTINFTGWRQIVWDIQNNPGTRWVGSGDGVITGPSLKLDSIHVSKGTGPGSGHIYFDQAEQETEGGTGEKQIAAIQYDGAYKLVYIAFPFETITKASVRNEVMKRVLSFFGY